MENNDQKPADEGNVKPAGTVIPPQQTVKPQQTVEPEVTSEPASQAVVSEDIDHEPVGISVSWSASEFVDHQKGFGWFFALVVIVILLAGGVFLLLHSIFSAVMIF